MNWKVSFMQRHPLLEVPFLTGSIFQPTLLGRMEPGPTWHIIFVSHTYVVPDALHTCMYLVVICHMWFPVAM